MVVVTSASHTHEYAPLPPPYTRQTRQWRDAAGTGDGLGGAGSSSGVFFDGANRHRADTGLSGDDGGGGGGDMEDVYGDGGGGGGGGGGGAGGMEGDGYDDVSSLFVLF